VSLERASKLLVVGWACAAVAFQAWSLRVIGLANPAAVFFALAFVAALIDRRAVSFVLAFTYVFPVLIWYFTGGYQAEVSVLWIAALVGATLPDALRTTWHLPVRWRAALVCWALVIAVGTTLVVLREIDFTLALFDNRSLSNTSHGLSPSTVALSVVHAGLVLVVGILWIDWLFGARGDNLRTVVLLPLALSVAAMCGIALYQMFHDVTFLNPTIFGGTGRAAGTMLDGNVCGTIAALWLGMAVWLAESGTRRRLVVSAAWVVLLLTVWASGSRSALGGGLVAIALSIVGLYGFKDRRSIVRLVGGSVSLAVILVAAVWALSVFQFQAAGPLSRMPPPTWAGIEQFVGDLWNRQDYGRAGVTMIRAFPWSGVGVGCYPVLLADFGGPPTPDNAQNWFRHQVAEFGVLGSLPWIVWTIGMAALVLAVRRHDTASHWAGRGVLIGFVITSFVGVPSQDVSVTITFWTACFWFIATAATETSATTPRMEQPARIGRWSWAAVTAVVLTFAFATVHAATGPLRVSVRAQRVGWPYEYGFYPPAPGAEGNERWTMRKAAAVVDAKTEWLSMTISVNPFAVVPRARPADTALAQPVDVRVWRDGKQVFERHFDNTAPATTLIRIPAGEPRVLLEARVSPTFRPSSLGVAGDDREFGALIKWEFVARPSAQP